jgi:hypothetical protein
MFWQLEVGFLIPDAGLILPEEDFVFFAGREGAASILMQYPSLDEERFTLDLSRPGQEKLVKVTPTPSKASGIPPATEDSVPLPVKGEGKDEDVPLQKKGPILTAEVEVGEPTTAAVGRAATDCGMLVPRETSFLVKRGLLSYVNIYYGHKKIHWTDSRRCQVQEALIRLTDLINVQAGGLGEKPPDQPYRVDRDALLIGKFTLRSPSGG